MDIQYIIKRIIQIIGEEKWLELCDDFYCTCYETVFDQTGYPIKNVLPKETQHCDMDIGDVIVLDEVNNYSRLYQRIPNGKRFLIIEQYLDTTSHDSEDEWLNEMPILKSVIINPHKHHSKSHIMTISELKEKEANQLWPELSKFMMSNNDKLFNYILKELPKEKIEIIHSYMIPNVSLWTCHYAVFLERYTEHQNKMFEV